MPSDASIFGMIRPQQPSPGPLDQFSQGLQIRHMMDQGQLSQMQREQLQRSMDEDAAVKAAFSGMQPGQTIGDIMPQVMQASPKTGVSMQKTLTEQQTAEAKLKKTNLESHALELKQLRDRLATVSTDQQLAQYVQEMTRLSGGKGQYDGPQSVNDPAFEAWRQKSIMTGDQMIERMMPKPPAGHTVGPDGKLLPIDPEYLKGQTAIAEAKRPVTNVNVSTEKKYGEQFAGQIAKQDADMLDAARKAPDLATRSNQVLETLGSGKVITGSGADVRLQIGKALNVAGASDAEVIANTELLTTDLARNTLDAIKASGLGAGNGFSNADRDFLEKAVGGKITLEASTIKRLAELSHKAAEQTSKKWGDRAKQIPKDALQGTGITTDAPAVPARWQPQAKSFTQEQIDAELARRGVRPQR